MRFVAFDTWLPDLSVAQSEHQHSKRNHKLGATPNSLPSKYLYLPPAQTVAEVIYMEDSCPRSSASMDHGDVQDIQSKRRASGRFKKTLDRRVAIAYVLFVLSPEVLFDSVSN